MRAASGSLLGARSLLIEPGAELVPIGGMPAALDPGALPGIGPVGGALGIARSSADVSPGNTQHFFSSSKYASICSPSLATFASGFIFVAIKDDRPDSHPEPFELPLGGGVFERVIFLSLGLPLPLSLEGPLIVAASGGWSEAATLVDNDLG